MLKGEIRQMIQEVSKAELQEVEKDQQKVTSGIIGSRRMPVGSGSIGPIGSDKRQDQTIVATGESGAGKSESAKLLMRHLAYTTARGASQRAEVPKADAKRPRLSRAGSARKLSIGKQSSRVVSDSHKSSFRDLGSIVEEMSEHLSACKGRTA